MDAGLIYTFAMLLIGSWLLAAFGMSEVGAKPPSNNGKLVLRYSRGFIYFCHFVLVMVLLWTAGLVNMIFSGRESSDILMVAAIILIAYTFCFLTYRGYHTVEVEFDTEGVWKHGQFGEQFVAWKDVTKISTKRGLFALSLYTKDEALHVSQYSSGLGTFAGYVRRFVDESALNGYEDILYQLQHQSEQ